MVNFLASHVRFQRVPKQGLIYPWKTNMFNISLQIDGWFKWLISIPFPLNMVPFTGWKFVHSSGGKEVIKSQHLKWSARIGCEGSMMIFQVGSETSRFALQNDFPEFWLQTKEMHNFLTSPILHSIWTFENAKPAKTFFFFGESFLFGGVTTIQVDYFNHPGFPDSRIPFPSFQHHHANGMLLPGDHLQPMVFLEVELKPATPRATIHPPTLCLPLPATAQRQRAAPRHGCFVGFFVEDFQALKGLGMKGTNILLEDRGQYLPGFFCSTDVSHVANVGWPISNFPISGRLQHRYIPITKRR